MAQITFGYGQILAEEQEIVTHLVSLVIQHGFCLLPESVWLWEDPRAAPLPTGMAQRTQSWALHSGAGQEDKRQWTQAKK